MRTFVHLTKADDPYLPKARAALWEWQDKLAKEKPEETIAPETKPDES
jgi:hypothetical protein